MLEQLLNHLKSIAPDVADIPMLQPADPFLESTGEDLRRRIFLTETADGTLKCLRPEFTIPICTHHIEHAASAARYAYGGTVFRQARSGANEFQQAGLEDIGNADTVSADAACIADMLQTVRLAGVEDFTVTLGDRELFAVLLQSLALPKAISGRLMRNFGEVEQLNTLIERLTQKNSSPTLDDEAVALIGDEAALAAHVEKRMEAAGISTKAGRSPLDIARRMIEKTSETSFVLEEGTAATLKRFLAIETSLSAAPDTLSKFAAEESAHFGDALSGFKQRAIAIEKSGVDLSTITYRASFGRKLDYYTGVLFEAHRSDQSEPIAGGGRYDRLCTLLGSQVAIPAVGFSIMLDRLVENGGEA